MDAIIRSALITANNVTSTLQEEVSVYTSTNGTFGTSYSPTATKYPALVERETKSVQSPGGEMLESRTTITFIQPIDVKYTDKIVLKDGTTDPIRAIQGLDDPSTGKPYMVQVFLGSGA
jgi:hypothetical protein